MARKIAFGRAVVIGAIASAVLGIAPAGLCPEALGQSTVLPTPSGQTRPESLAQGFIILVRDRAGRSNASSPIYVASNHGNWNPSNPAGLMTARSDGLWQLELPKPQSRDAMEFKFTRGSWEICEATKALADAPNRTLPGIDASKLKEGEKPILMFEVDAWTDQRPEVNLRVTLSPYRKLEVTGSVKRLQVAGGAGGAVGVVRDLLVATPPGYDDAANAGRAYPVLYLQDGQNVFEKLPGVPGEWHADEALQALVNAGLMEPVIIVGIPNSGAARMEEYSPYPIKGSTPRGDEYLVWMMREVMPRVERAYRVKTGPEHTAIGGASLGGVISLYAATKHPEVFGLCLAESVPTLGESKEAWEGYLKGAKRWPSRLFLGMGDHEAGIDESAVKLNEMYEAWANDLRDTAQKAGVKQVMLMVGENQSHNEAAWAARLPAGMKWLFPVRKPVGSSQ
jgi:predicted alpha/beta superfamily hydrolase